MLTYSKFDQFINPFVPGVGDIWQLKKPIKFNAYEATLPKSDGKYVALLEKKSGHNHVNDTYYRTLKNENLRKE